MTDADLFALHRAVQTEAVVDIYQPVGAWKVEPNSAAVVIDGQVGTNDTYALPRDVPPLMEIWTMQLREFLASTQATDFDGVASFAWLHAAFVRIHPFADGNGRMARLVANLPLLRAGLPPVLIPLSRRAEYVEILARWQIMSGRPRPGEALVSESSEFRAFREFCEDASREVDDMIDETRQRQQARNRESKEPCG